MGAIGDMASSAGFNLPSFSTQGISGTLSTVFVAICVGLVMFLGIFYFFQYIKFNKYIVVFKKVNNVPTIIRKDKAKLERLGLGGDFWLMCRKYKKTLPRPSIEIAKNTYWFYEREDGEWINFRLEDIDASQKEAKAHYVEEDMRLQRLGIQKNLEARFRKDGFWKKHGATIMFVMFVMIVTVCLVVLFGKLAGLWDQMADTALAIEHMASSVETLSTRVGGGVVRA